VVDMLGSWRQFDQLAVALMLGEDVAVKHSCITMPILLHATISGTLVELLGTLVAVTCVQACGEVRRESTQPITSRPVASNTRLNSVMNSSP
jgi:ABC-type uncharacterized transport system permease subunit